MGFYLNSRRPAALYASEAAKLYFVDKTQMLAELMPMVKTSNNYLCVVRPRRFGKTIMANMICAFFGRSQDTTNVFGHLKIAQNEDYCKHINQYNVFYISCNEVPQNCHSYKQYIQRIENYLLHDLKNAYPEYSISGDIAVWDILNELWENENAEFIFVLDEWDYIFHQDFVSESDKKSYMRFLSNLLKDKAYVRFAYITGILPIAKYSSGSELNMFAEFTMAKTPAFSEYFGFTESEVDDLYQRYTKNCKKPELSREGLRTWYDGYYTASGEQLYNPRSVVFALSFNHLESYWTRACLKNTSRHLHAPLRGIFDPNSGYIARYAPFIRAKSPTKWNAQLTKSIFQTRSSSGPYDEVYYYIEKNVDDVRDDLALMVSGIPVAAKIQEYAATSMNLTTKNEIFSAMVVYGFLTYRNGAVSIPNKELMDKFSDLVQKESSLGYVYQIAKSSERMLKATLDGDTTTIVNLLEFAHNTEVPLLSYNNETELTAIVNLVYLSARDLYRIEREDKAGIGYVDFIFYPENKAADCIILELKVDHTPEEAIQQIKDRKYALRFATGLGGKTRYTGRILAVGIAYDKEMKKHSCKIEVLRECCD